MNAKVRGNKVNGEREAIKRRQEYEERLMRHPKVKALRQERPQEPRGSLRRGVPEIVANAMQDKELVKCISAVRRLNRYERKVDDMVHRRIKKESVSLGDEIKLIREGSKVDRDFSETIVTMARKIYHDPARKAYVAAVEDNPVPREIVGNLSLHLTPKEKAAMKYLGWGPDHAIWNDISGTGQEKEQLAQDISPKDRTRLLKVLEGSGDEKFNYSRAPRHLVGESTLTLNGNDAATDALVLFILWLYFFVSRWLAKEAAKNAQARLIGYAGQAAGLIVFILL